MTILGWLLFVVGILFLAAQVAVVLIQINAGAPSQGNIRLWAPGLVLVIVGVVMLVRG